jgi:pentatricopeptide repeat-containing protein PET309
MLERATACLDSGARLSVRCARRASRSNRSLGSTFWNHGAGDLDLAPWATAHTTQPPLDVHGSTQLPRRASKKEQEKRVDSPPVESPFLDFLYPPQALALLHRNGNHHTERWERRNERRNERRLPKGFIQANRQYSSKAKVRRRLLTADIVTPREETANDMPQDTSEADMDGWNDPYGDQVQPLDVPIVANGPLAQSDLSRQTGESDDLSSADSPAELAEKAEITAAFRMSKELRSYIAIPDSDTALKQPGRSLKFSVEHIEHAWSLYEQLEPRDREDIGLKVKLLEWLSKYRNEAAETHCLELYHAIPPTRRTFAVYKSALPTFIRSNLYGLAEQGHAEALDQLENGHELSVWLCSTAIENEMWDLASRVKQQLDAKHGGQAREWVDNIFWRQIAKTPDLLSKAINLSKHFRMLKQADAITADFERYSISMYKVAIIQQFTTSTVNRKVPRAERTLNDGRIRYLIGRIQLTNADSPAFLQDIIRTLIDPASNVRYPDAHKTVSYIYRQHRSMPHAYLPEDVHFALMKRVVEYTDIAARKREQAWGLSPYTLEQEWVKQFGKMSLEMYKWLLLHYARGGNVELVQYYHGGLLADYPDYPEHRDALWTLVYVHARRADVKSAVAAFEAVQDSATAAGSYVKLRVWNALLHAHSRADDIDGGLATMKKLVASGHTLDQYSFHPLLDLYAARGDIDSVMDLLEQYDQLSGVPRTTALYGSLMVAYKNTNDLESARKVLQELVPKVQAGEVKGTLTKCFNILLAGLALQREIDETMRVYQWMKEEQIEVDSMTYAALMQGLTTHRQADAAWKILNLAMPEKGIQPQAFHYAIVMTGFVKQHAYKTALDIHKQMLSKDIKPALSTNAIYIKAKALYELRQAPRKGGNVDQYPVERIIEELEEIFRDPAAGLAAHEPQSYSATTDHSPQALLLSHLIYVYGAAKSVDAVQTLIQRFTQAAHNDGTSDSTELPLRLLSAIMPSYIQAENWDEVGRCWHLAKEQADAIAISNPVVQLAPHSEVQTAPDILKLSVGETTGEVTKTASLLAKAKPEDPSRPKPALRHILSQPLRHHITALAQQSRFSEMVSTVANVLGQGYILDNITWNIFIELLLRPSPPLALLAFRLTERYLIPSFPGWIKGKPVLNHSARVQGLQYIRARYLSPDQRMPRYRTLVKLAAAVLEIRRADALGIRKGKSTATGYENLRKYVGTMKQIQQHAPRTLYAVQSMPTVDDQLQTTLLRRESYT